MARARGARAIDPAPGARSRAQTVRIGLTGPIGCGKTSVAQWLGELGAAVIDADEVVRRVTAPGEPAHATILAQFGDAVRAANGTLDRAALAALVFSSPERLRELESIVHPAVRPRILAAIEAAERQAAPAVVVEAIKLVDGGLAELCDEVWLITCTREAQRERLEARGLTRDDAARRLATQTGLADRLRSVATRVIDTSGDAGSARIAVERAWEAAVARSRGLLGRA